MFCLTDDVKSLQFLRPSMFQGAFSRASGYATAAAMLLVAVEAFSSTNRGQNQRTIEGAIVWNNYPKAEDRVSWTGGKDSLRYASGSGTLNWFKGSRLVS